MRAFKTILLVVIALLVLADVSWRVWAWRHYAAGRAVLAHFKVEYTHTNDWSGIGIFDAKTSKPVWVRWDIGHDGNSSIESSYFQGHDVLDVTTTSNGPPKYSVFFGGPGKSVTWWLDRLGSGSFTERIFYDTNGVPAKHEVWYDNAWQLVDRRDGTNGLVIDGQWHQLAIDTNRTWTTKAASINHHAY
jgi:hypothetical protein